MSNPGKINIAVIGSRNCSKNTKLWELSYEVGKLIATAGYNLITGAAKGVSQAAALGASDCNGFVIGIPPSAFSSHEKTEVAIDNIDLLIETALIPKSRNVITILNSNAVIALAGNYGTLNEITIAISHNIPLVIIRGLGGISDIMDIILKQLGSDGNVTIVSTPKEALEIVKAILYDTK